MRKVYNLSTGEVTEHEDAAPTVIAISDTEKIEIYRAAVGEHINSSARLLGFDSILSAVSYADEPADVVNQDYGVALREWRSLCWLHCRNELTAWQAGGDEPTIESIIAGLPSYP